MSDHSVVTKYDSVVVKMGSTPKDKSNKTTNEGVIVMFVILLLLSFGVEWYYFYQNWNILVVQYKHFVMWHDTMVEERSPSIKWIILWIDVIPQL